MRIFGFSLVRFDSWKLSLTHLNTEGAQSEIPGSSGSFLRSLSSALVVFILNLQGASGTWAMQIGLLSLAWGSLLAGGSSELAQISS